MNAVSQESAGVVKLNETLIQIRLFLKSVESWN